MSVSKTQQSSPNLYVVKYSAFTDKPDATVTSRLVAVTV
jgi:hypothetical protein